jgi:hypothetical protein
MIVKLLFRKHACAGFILVLLCRHRMFLDRVAVPVLDGLRVLVCVVVFLAFIDGGLCVLGLRLGLRLGLEIEVRASCCEGATGNDPGEISERVVCRLDVAPKVYLEE